MNEVEKKVTNFFSFYQQILKMCDFGYDQPLIDTAIIPFKLIQFIETYVFWNFFNLKPI